MQSIYLNPLGEQAIIKMVQGMHANGLDLKTIAVVTKLTKTEISSLLGSLRN
jgi:hypothetical protein